MLEGFSPGNYLRLFDDRGDYSTAKAVISAELMGVREWLGSAGELGWNN